MLAVQIASCSRVGARAHNEDDLRTGERDGIAWAVLSDGAGGHRHGAVASDLVVRAVALVLQAERALAPPVLHDALHDAHELLLARQQQGAGERERMHATLVALWLDAGRAQALWSHVGDSRLYLLRDGQVQHVTRDDSVVQQMIDAGLLTPEGAREHPHRSHLLCAMGVEAGFAAHTLERTYALRAGDAFLLCTDGWWDALDRTAIERTRAQAANADDWLARMRALIDAAHLPDQDNLSAIAVWLEEKGT
jgi:PPM family protein phosphatase